MGEFLWDRLLIVEDEIAVRDTLTELVAKDGRELNGK
jgi:hypothetical protein